MKRKKNKKVYDALMEKHSDYLLQAGWFEQSRYSNGAPIGGIAAVQNYGAVIHQTVTEKQRAFLHYLGIHLKATTNNLTIVIPPTHFWEGCQEKNKSKWKEKIKEAWTAVFLGKINADKAMDVIAGMIEGDIVKEIKEISEPPLAESTINKRKSRYKDTKTTGSLTKRLIDNAIMINAVSHKVTKI